MTKQELLQNIKSKNPQYANVDDDMLLNAAIKQRPDLQNQLLDYEVPKNSYISVNEIQPTPEQPKEEEDGFWSRLKDRFGTFMGEAKEIREETGAKDLATNVVYPRTALREAGSAARFVAETGFDVAMQGLKGMSWLAEKISRTPDGTSEATVEKGKQLIAKFLQTESGKSVAEMAQAGGELWAMAEEKYPELAQDVKDVTAVLEVVGGSKIAKETLDVTGSALRGTKNLVEEAVKPRIMSKSKEKIDKLVGEIVQAKDKKTLKRAKETLKNIDTSDVKTYKDFSDKIVDDISALGAKQSELLEADGRIFRVNDFTKSVGEKEQNFINRALEQLEELYDKTQADDKLLALQNKRKKFMDEGITLKEINDLSIEYSKEMPSAFSKMGDPLTSVNKVASENTRKGLKDLLRKELPDDTSKLLDEQMSNLFAIQKSITKMEEAVQNLTNKVIKRGYAERVGRKLGQLLQMIPGSGSIKGLINSFLHSNVGNKSMNALELEKNLSKALKKFDKLNNRIDRLSEDNAATAIYAILREFKKNQDGFATIPGKQKLTPESRGQTYLSPNEISKIQREAADKEKLLKNSSKKDRGEIPTTTDTEVAKILRGTKGMTADDIMKKYPDIELKRDVQAKDLSGKKVVIPKGEELTPYELKGNKVLLQDGETYLVNKNQFQNIKGQSISAEAKPFAPELGGLEETVKGGETLPEYRTKILKKYKANNMSDALKKMTEKEKAKFYEIETNTLGSGERTAPKFSQYQLPGGKNYKEILFTKPVKTRTVKDFQGKSVESGVDTFYSHAFPEVNNYGWLRINEHTNTKYGKVSFLEEIQHVKPKELGGTDNITLEQYKALPKHMKGNEFYNTHLKRALKEAVDNDSDYFAWITGEQTSARYNLATKVDEIAWEMGTGNSKITYITPKGRGQRQMQVTSDKNGKILGGGEPSWKGKKLDQALGKGLADSIMAKETGTLSGEGLKFGGEWAENLYDRQVKNIVEKLTGAKAQKLDLGLPIESGKAPKFIIRRGKLMKDGRRMTDDLRPKDLKVGAEIQTPGDVKYIITDILGDGKFKAVNKGNLQYLNRRGTEKTIKGQLEYAKANIQNFDTIHKETFDISTKTTQQQAIKLTPEIKAKIRGEAPKIKASGKMFEDGFTTIEGLLKTTAGTAGITALALFGLSKFKGNEENKFLDDYKKIANQIGIDPDPDNPLHYYDYRSAWKNGDMKVGDELHFSSTYKLPGHPRLVVNGKDTRTGEKADYEKIKEDVKKLGWDKQEIEDYIKLLRSNTQGGY
jgi:hypothetical protein